MSAKDNNNKKPSKNGKKQNFIQRNKLPIAAAFIAAGVIHYDEAYDYLFGEDTQTVSLTEFDQKSRDGQITNVTIDGTQITGITEDGTIYVTSMPETFDAVGRLIDTGTKITYVESSEAESKIFDSLLSIFTWLAIFGGVTYMGGRALSKVKLNLGDLDDKLKLGKPKAEKPKVTFEDVAGIDEIENDLAELVEFMKNPGHFEAAGAKMPKGVMLDGPPGTGKTLLAKAMAGEADATFFTLAGTDFVSKYVGVGKDRVAEIFEEARKSVKEAKKEGKKNASAIIFIDEIDAIGKNRNLSSGKAGSHDDILTKLLDEMDGFDGSDGVMVLAATNRPDVLDPALLRPGRFDRRLTVPLPLEKGRYEILQVHTKNKPLSKDVDLQEIAAHTRGFSGAALANLANEAAIMAARRKNGSKTQITQDDLNLAVDKVTLGPERTLHMTDEAQFTTDVHESGHALVGLAMEKSGLNHVSKMTGTPRGQALGVTIFKPQEEHVQMNLEQFKAHLAVIFAGRAAEEIVFGKEKVTNGASGDIQQFTDMAWQAITQWGFTEELGMVLLGRTSGGHLGGSPRTDHGLNDHTAEQIQNELRTIANETYEEAKRILQEHKEDLLKLSLELNKREMLSREEMLEIISFKPEEKPAFKMPESTHDFVGLGEMSPS